MACSGGRDSAALLHALAGPAREHGFRLICLHVDHGLQEQSAGWVGQVAQLAAGLGVEFDHRRVTVGSTRGQGLEAAARSARYAALQAMCAAHGVGVLAVGHHALDQAETLLMRLLRGSGPRGLAGMRDWRDPAADRPAHWRPMLALHPQAIAAYAAAHAIAHVDDPTNALHDQLRNALRHRVLAPLLDIAPHALDTLGRSARLLGAADASLENLIAADLAACRLPDASAPTLSLTALAALDSYRRGSVLQRWLEAAGCAPPPEAWLDQAWRQLSQAAADSAPDLRWQQHQLLRHRDRVACLPAFEPPAAEAQLRWDGEPSWTLPQWRGAWQFVPAAVGIPGALLRTAPLRAVARSGGERLRIDPRRPSRSLRQWYQSLDVPPWQRQRAPLLWLGRTLLHVPGVGSACEPVTSGDDCWQLGWRSDA